MCIIYCFINNFLLCFIFKFNYIFLINIHKFHNKIYFNCFFYIFLIYLLLKKIKNRKKKKKAGIYVLVMFKKLIYLQLYKFIIDIRYRINRFPYA